MKRLLKKSIVYEVSTNYDGSQNKTHDILTKIKVNVWNPLKQGDSPKKIWNCKWYQRNPC